MAGTFTWQALGVAQLSNKIQFTFVFGHSTIRAQRHYNQNQNAPEGSKAVTVALMTLFDIMQANWAELTVGLSAAVAQLALQL